MNKPLMPSQHEKQVVHKVGSVGSRSAMPTQSAWHYRGLIMSLTRREIEQKYKGSLAGGLWSLLNPLLLLAIYTFVFGEVFKMRWPALEQHPTNFAIMLFAGLLAFNFFSECMGRASGLIASNPNLVKKIVFPLHIQAWSVVAAAAFQLAVSLLVLVAASLFFRGGIPWTAIFLPLVFIPLLLFVLACVWIISALGVYLRDLGQIVGHVVTMLMFLSPLFYPEEAIPENFRGLLKLNPLTYFIDEFRAVLVLGKLPEWTSLALHLFFAALAARLGLWFFQRLRPGFSDVL